MRDSFKKTLVFLLLILSLFSCCSCGRFNFRSSFEWKKNHQGKYVDNSKTIVSFQENEYYLVDDSFYALKSTDQVVVHVTQKEVPYLLAEYFEEECGTAFADKTYIVIGSRWYLREDFYKKYYDQNADFLGHYMTYSKSVVPNGGYDKTTAKFIKFETASLINQILEGEPKPYEYFSDDFKNLRSRKLIRCDRSGNFIPVFPLDLQCFISSRGTHHILETKNIDGIFEYSVYDIPEEHNDLFMELYE